MACTTRVWISVLFEGRVDKKGVTNKQPDRERYKLEESDAIEGHFIHCSIDAPPLNSRRYQSSTSSSSSATAETAPRPLRLEARALPAVEAGLDDLEAGLVTLVLEAGLVLDLWGGKIGKSNDESWHR